jgi:RHS repeat-associated protein
LKRASIAPNPKEKQIREQRVNADINSTVEMNYVYAYDGWGRMKSVTLNNILLNDYTYDDALGLVKRVRYYDEAIGCGAVVVDTVQMVYDDRDRLTDLTSHFYAEYLYYDAAHPQTADTSFAVQASKNYNGNINAMKSVYKLDRATYNPGTFEGATVYGFQYDGLNRLTSADASVMDVLTGDPSQATPARLYGDEAYTYDKAGNIKTLVRGMYYHASVQNPANWVQRWTYKYQSGTSKLVSIDSSNISLRTYAYDANGNTRADVFRGLTSTTMNRANLPVACLVDGEAIKSSFDVLDLRIYKENASTGAKTFYWLSGSGAALGVLTQVNGSWAQGVWEFYAGTAKVKNGERHFSVSDANGNTRVVYHTNATCSGTSYVLDQVNDYYPFGKSLREFVNERERYTFNGNEREEESGLDYFNARYYDADVCRFLGVDPVVKWHESGYAAFGNNPIYYTDPSGLDASGGAPEKKGKKEDELYIDSDGNRYQWITDVNGNSTWHYVSSEAVIKPKPNFIFEFFGFGFYGAAAPAPTQPASKPWSWQDYAGYGAKRVATYAATRAIPVLGWVLTTCDILEATTGYNPLTPTNRELVTTTTTHLPDMPLVTVITLHQDKTAVAPLVPVILQPADAEESVPSGTFAKGLSVLFAKEKAKIEGESGGEEHTSGARPSTKEKHQKGRARKARDYGGEKGDKSRRPPNKRPHGYKGSWPKKNK